MKSTMLLATALFLISAPAPDSDDIAEMTSNLIVLKQANGLLAADELPNHQTRAIQQSTFDADMVAIQLPGPAGHDDTAVNPAG